MRTILIVSTILFGSALAQADEPNEGGREPVDHSYSFDDDVVMGASYDPDLERVFVHSRGRRSSLIEVRSSLLPELLSSVENL